MKRRGFLGFIGGAAVVGPSAVKNTVAQMPSGLGLPMSGDIRGYGGSVPTAAGIGSGDWRLEEIARLKRFITGELTDAERESERVNLIRSRETLINQHAAALVSVSAVSKIAIFNRDMRRLHREIDVLNNSSYLKQLMAEISK